MSFKRIKAILLQEYFITLRSYEVIFDVFIVSLVSLLLFGFLSLYLAGNRNSVIGQYLLTGMILWEVVRITQYTISLGSMWNIWSRNLTNIFIAPISVMEYLLAHTLSGTIKAALLFIVNSVMSLLVFHVNIFQLGIINLLLYFFSLTIFSFSAGIIIIGLVFRYGTRIQAFSWGIVPILQPLTGVFFPIKILPAPLRDIALIFPNTHIFEAARNSLTTHSIDFYEISLSYLLDGLFLIFAILFFKWMFYKAKDSGQFARNEGG